MLKVFKLLVNNSMLFIIDTNRVKSLFNELEHWNCIISINY